MAAKPARYPTAAEIQKLSAQELIDRKIVNLAPASYGQLDTRIK